MASDGYTPEVHAKIIEGLTTGRSLLSICRDEGMPSYVTVLRWRKKYPELDEAIPRAREEGAHVLAEQCLDIADSQELDPSDKRIRIDTRLRLIGKWNARSYGEKLDLTHGGEIGIRKVEVEFVRPKAPDA